MTDGCLHALIWLNVDFKQSTNQLPNVELLLGWMWPLQSWNWTRSAMSSVPTQRFCYWLLLKVKEKKEKKKSSLVMVQLQFLVVVLLKLSWWFFLDILKRCLGQLACMWLLPVWSEVEECLNGVLHLVPEENAHKIIVPITMLSQWY